jgi:hypothetical protein
MGYSTELMMITPSTSFIMLLLSGIISYGLEKLASVLRSQRAESTIDGNPINSAEAGRPSVALIVTLRLGASAAPAVPLLVAVYAIAADMADGIASSTLLLASLLIIGAIFLWLGQFYIWDEQRHLGSSNNGRTAI